MRCKAKIKVTKPKVTSAELAPKYPVVVTVNRNSFQLRLFKKLRLAKTYPIAVGQAGLETPAGLYHIQNKQVDPAWSVPNKDWAGDLAGTTVPGGAPDNPLKARWLGIFDGAGIHGTSDVGSLGSAASHGCIRMDVPDVIELYDQVPVGAPVYILAEGSARSPRPGLPPSRRPPERLCGRRSEYRPCRSRPRALGHGRACASRRRPPSTHPGFPERDARVGRAARPPRSRPGLDQLAIWSRRDRYLSR